MKGYIATCFSDWIKDTFARGPMKMRKGAQTDIPIRHPLPPEWKEGGDYYIKPDPDFETLTYSQGYLALRRKILPGDVLFFKTLWRANQYFVGYFTIREKTGDEDDPILIADPKKSLFIPNFTARIWPEIVQTLNPRVREWHLATYSPNVLAMFLGRGLYALNRQRTMYLMRLLRERARR